MGSPAQQQPDSASPQFSAQAPDPLKHLSLSNTEAVTL